MALVDRSDLHRYGFGLPPSRKRVQALGAFGDFGEISWEDWCDSPNGQAKYGLDEEGKPFTWVCKREFALGGAIPFAPWTDVGMTLRFEAAGLLPKWWEYDPIRLWTTMYQNPRRFFHLTVIASLIPGIAVQAAGVAGAAGPLYMTPFGFGVLAYDRAYQTFYAQAKEKGTTDPDGPDGYARSMIWETMFKPALTDAGELVMKVLTYGPWTGIALHGMKHEGQNPKNGPIQRAIFTALADNSELLGYALKGVDAFKDENAIGALGRGMMGAAEIIGKSGASQDVVNVIYSIGKSHVFFKATIAALFRGEVAEALDQAFYACFGVKLTTFKALGTNIQSLAATKNADAIQTVGLISQGAGEVSKAFQQINFQQAATFFSELIKPIQDVVALIAGTTKAIEAPVGTPATANLSPAAAASVASIGISPRPSTTILQRVPPIATQNLPSVAPASTPVAVAPTGQSVVLRPPVTVVPPRAEVIVPPKPATSGAGLIAGAGAGAAAGFVVGGPPGAAAGAAVGAIIAAMRGSK